jgi:hypothetical protein
MSKIQLTYLNNSAYLTELDCNQLNSVAGGKGRSYQSQYRIEADLTRRGVDPTNANVRRVQLGLPIPK